MPRQLKHVIREPLKLQRLKRRYKRNVGEQGTTYLAKVNGSVEGTITGHFWVHDAKGTDDNGNTVYGAAYQLPILPGAAIEQRPDIKVETIVQGGRRYIARMAFTELVKMGYNPHQTNMLNPRRKYILFEHISNLQSFPYSGLIVRVMPSIYRKSDEEYAFYAGSVAIDLTSYVPSTTDKQVVVCLWLDVDTNTVTITSSSEVDATTDLKNNPSTAMTYINECADAAPVGAIGISSYLLFDDTTAISIKNKFHDLRGIIGAGGGVSTQTLNVIDGDRLIPSGKDAFFAGVLQVTSGTLSVEGELYVL